MDHEVSQCCSIYYLEDVRIQPGESPDELFDCLFTDRCNFPSEEEKECNVQYHFAHVLNDKELVKKLLSLKLTASTAKMLEVHRTHIPISYNLDVLGLADPKAIHVICNGKPMKQHLQG